MDVTDILRDRMHEPDGLRRMAVVSVLVHGAVVAALVVAPGGWLSQPEAPPKTVMTISLGGGNGGPTSGGMTSIGGRAVQTQTPPEAPKRPEPIRPPAARTPEMTVPLPGTVPRKPAPAAPVKQAPDDARGTTPTKGAEPREGSAIAETGARGQGFGLTTSGGAGSGSTIDVADFCCPEYLIDMVNRIRGNWNARAEVAGLVIVLFTIQRDGTLTGSSVEKTSNYTALDINALRAVVATRQLAPLPAAFPNPSLTVHLHFEYTR
ncbi:MAG: TonB family protein [Luteitalea sp.]|nr:TonB family protein [Luteitalea sp.]